MISYLIVVVIASVSENKWRVYSNSMRIGHNYALKILSKNTGANFWNPFGTDLCSYTSSQPDS